MESAIPVCGILDGRLKQKKFTEDLGLVGIGTTSPGSVIDVKGTLRLSGATSGYVGLAPAATAGSTTYTLPSGDGTTGQVLTTNGSGVLSWTNGANITTSPVAFSVNRNGTNQTVANGGYTKVIWSNVEFDTNSNFANSKFTPTVAGKYQINAACIAPTLQAICAVGIYKNGSLYRQGFQRTSSTYGQIATLIDLNGTTDYLEIYTVNGGGTTLDGGVLGTFFQGYLTSSTTTSSTGSGTANYIPQWTSSTALGNSPIAVSGGNVGIGTTSPTVPLHVKGGILSLLAADPSAEVAAPLMKAMASSGYSSNPVYSFWYQAGTGISNPASQSIGFNTSSSERLRIDSSGNVGVGTTSPGAILDINSTTSGFLPPRMTATQRDAISSPAAGLAIYNTTNSRLEVYNGSSWSSASGSSSQEVVQGANVTMSSSWVFTDVLSLTVTSGQRSLILASGNNKAPNPWTYFSTQCNLTLNGSTIDTKYFYYGSINSGSGPGMPMFHYSLQTLTTGDVIKVRCAASTDAASSTAEGWKISLVGLGVSNISGGDNLGNHLATQNLNLGSYQMVGNSGTSGISISNTGNVGIGTTSPGSTLTVNGVIESKSGGIRFPDGTVQTSAASTSSGTNGLGAWQTKSLSTIYQATTDGLVVATIVGTSNWGSMTGYTDSNSSPTTIRGYCFTRLLSDRSRSHRFYNASEGW